MLRSLLPAAALAACAALLMPPPDARAEAPERRPGHTAEPDFRTMRWENIGPSRGGRAQACSGVIGDPNTYYMGATGGGVWKTSNAGASWTNVTDGFVGTGSVGDVAVAASDSNVVYVGMGEADIRGNFSHGDGVYRSLDAGKTWEHVGLEDSRQIGRIAIHPDDPDVVFVAALGHVFGPNAQRGVFRSTDSGETWERVLYIDDRTGAVDVRMDPNNPRVLYAGMWRAGRTPWSLSSGGPGSGLYRSLDGGDTWEELTRGLPKGIKGKVGVSPSAARRDLVYAIIEAEDGGVFRSTDGGDSWTRVNENRSLRQRAWYYTHIYADPVEPDTVYVLNVRFHKSIDGGRSFSTIRAPHSDHHDLWIDPNDNQRLVNANDGGANVSFDAGATWSTQTNQPTAQFYGVTVDNNFPYRVYGAQQDNSTASISSQNRLGRWERDLYSVGGGESGYIAVRPDNPDIVYAGSYGGYMTRYDHETGVTRNIMVWPENPMGAGAVDLVHRFQWTFPIVISPHDPDVLYVGGERLFRSADEGQSWDPISPDLSTDDETKQQSSGGPITQDNTSVEYYATIFTVAESPLRKDMIWVGTDDGRVHVTFDAGDSWNEVTPQDMGDWPLVSMAEASSHDADTAYLAVNRYKMDDFSPYIYRTRDAGKTWDLIVDGIGADAFVRSVREDPIVPGLLYAGTETGVYVSLDDGETWKSLQNNLPIVPITDLVVKNDDLVVSTQGRSFWILRDVSALRQMAAGEKPHGVHLYEPRAAWRQGWDVVRIHYNLPEGFGEDVRIEILDADDDVLRTFPEEDASARNEEDEEEQERPWAGGSWSGGVPPAEEGMNVFAWNMRRPDPVRVPGAAAWPPHPPGPMAAPGRYTVRLTAGDRTMGAPLELLPSPEVDTTPRGYREQAALLADIHEALNDAHRAVNRIRAVRAQVDAAVERSSETSGAEAIRSAGEAFKSDLRAVEETIIQTRSKSAQDPLNYPIKINDKIGGLHYVVEGNFRPTRAAYEVFDRLRGMLDEALEDLDEAMDAHAAAFNALVRDQGAPAIAPELITEGRAPAAMSR